MKRKQFHERRQIIISVEKDRWNEFVELCDKERKSQSLKIDEILINELQKNPLGEEVGPRASPLANIEKYKKTNKRSSHKELDPAQCDLRSWLPRDMAYKMAKTVNLDSNQWKHLGETFIQIAMKKRTGYL